MDAVANKGLVRREACLCRNIFDDVAEILEGRPRSTCSDRLVQTFPGAGDQVEVLLRDGVTDRVCKEETNQLEICAASFEFAQVALRSEW